jgi:glutamate synthase domain-containing protein 1
MALVTHKGVHGTTANAADSIMTNGFKPSRDGRAGRGVYFWHVNRYAESLAVEWVRAEQGSSVKIALVYADLSCDEREILDLENQVLVDRLSELAFKRGITKDMKADKISELYDFYVASLEKKLQISFKLIKKKLAPPRKEYSSYPIVALGAPLAYIVRDVSIIQNGRRVDK